MQLVGDYQNGYAKAERLLEPELAAQFLAEVFTAGGITPQHLEVLGENRDIPPRLRLRRQGLWERAAATYEPSPIGNRAHAVMHGQQFPLLRTFHFGLAPAMSEIAQRTLLPTYCYFRIYQKGDVCRVHCDRPQCDHSLSLTLAYSDRLKWGLGVQTRPTQPNEEVTEDFAGEPYTEVMMNPGDALAYRGELHRHGRITPNPNSWSAHLFLHFVEKNGPHGDLAFTVS